MVGAEGAVEAAWRRGQKFAAAALSHCREQFFHPIEIGVIFRAQADIDLWVVVARRRDFSDAGRKPQGCESDHAMRIDLFGEAFVFDPPGSARDFRISVRMQDRGEERRFHPSAGMKREAVAYQGVVTHHPSVFHTHITVVGIQSAVIFRQDHQVARFSVEVEIFADLR